MKEADYVVPIISIKPKYNVSFHGDNGKEIGEINWDDGILKFSGNIEESAKIFFDFLKSRIDEYIENEIKKKA